METWNGEIETQIEKQTWSKLINIVVKNVRTDANKTSDEKLMELNIDEQTVHV